MVNIARTSQLISLNKINEWRFSLRVLFLTNLIVGFLTAWYSGWYDDDIRYLTSGTTIIPDDNDPIYSLIPPEGPAQARPSIQVSTKVYEDTEGRVIYGGNGVDKAHLGGFTDLDEHGISPAAWHWMMEYIGIHSLIDVGCGRGISTSWFYFHGISDILCVEGSHDAYENSILPSPQTQMVEHDFSQGPWWPERTYDAVWCVEFLEHVGRNFQKNYIPTFRKAALIFATHSIWGGHHHVEVHDETWWIHRMEMFGFVYSEDLTHKIREKAIKEQYNGTAPNGMPLNGQHIWLIMKVFINPAVASLPQHAHLLAEPGCFHGYTKGHRECGQGEDGNAGTQTKLETVLPQEYRAIPTNPKQDDDWYQHVKARVKDKTKEGKEKFEELEKDRLEHAEKMKKEKEKKLKGSR